jgi:hypothetical protein
MENPTFIGVSISDARVIMAIMCALAVVLLCQVVTGRVLVLEGLLPGTRGQRRLRPFLSGIKCPHFLKTRTLELVARYWEPPGVAAGGPRVCRARSQ